MNIKLVKNDISDALKIREEVFVKEQGIASDIINADFDKLDTTKHYIYYNENNKAIASLALLDMGKEYMIKRVCVLKDFRRSGIGAKLMERVIQSHTDKPITLNSQLSTEAFYWAVGFRSQGDMFLEVDIPHIKMVYNGK